MNKITLVWQKDPSTLWESEWINFLFEDICDEVVINLDHSKFINNSIIIDTLHAAPYHNAYAREMRNRGLKFGLFHLTDEGSDNDITSYPDCNFVIRNFYRQNMLPHVLTIPLGWTTGTRNQNTDKSIQQRKLLWSCIVHRLDQSRIDLSQAFQNLPDGSFYAVGHHGPRMSTQQMAEVYNNSIFVPCPSGRITPESFRVFESLENGAIPIVSKTDYWKLCYGNDFPAIQVSNWNEAKEIILDMIKDTEVLEAFRKHCVLWWEKSKAETKTSVYKLINQTIL